MKPPKDLPSFLQDDDIDENTLLEVTMNDGSRFTGTIGDISDDWERMEWDVVTDPIQRKRQSSKVVVPIRSIATATRVAEPISQPQLPPDSVERKPLNRATFSLQSGVLFAAAFGVMFAIFNTHDWWWPTRWQLIAAVAYTTVILVGTFASVQVGSVLPEIPFTRTEVRTALPRLALIHVGFLIAWMVMASVAIAAQPTLPAWMNAKFGRGSTLFTFAIGILFFAIVSKQVSMNHRLLANKNRAPALP